MLGAQIGGGSPVASLQYEVPFLFEGDPDQLAGDRVVFDDQDLSWSHRGLRRILRPALALSAITAPTWHAVPRCEASLEPVKRVGHRNPPAPAWPVRSREADARLNAVGWVRASKAPGQFMKEPWQLVRTGALVRRVDDASVKAMELLASTRHP